MKINKTNAARLLDKAGISYELIPYQVDEDDLSAVHVASSLGEDVNRVYKTIVLRGDRNGRGGSGSEEGCKSFRKQKRRHRACQRSPGTYGLHTRRMFARGHEETVSGFHFFGSLVARLCICERRCAWPPDEAGSFRSDTGDRGESGGNHLTLTGKWIFSPRKNAPPSWRGYGERTPSRN